MKTKVRIYEILEVARTGDRASRIFDIFIMVLISLNVIAIILETVESLAAYMPLFRGFEIFSIIIFTIEYLLRLWVCTKNKKFRNPIQGRIRFAFTPLALIDLLAILPFYLPVVSVSLK